MATASELGDSEDKVLSLRPQKALDEAERLLGGLQTGPAEEGQGM